MPDSLRVSPRSRARPAALTAASRAVPSQEFRATASASRGAWQAEAWGFYDTLGEFGGAVDWIARGMSRVRLVAAEVLPTGPRVVDEGPAADLMARFAGGSPGQAAFLNSITPHLEVPGEGWLVIERASPMVPLSMADWLVLPAEAVNSTGRGYQVQTSADQRWRPLAEESLPIRVWQPHPRAPWLARSPAQAAIPIMRRIELVDKRIIAMMISRLAMNGLLLMPEEGMVAVPEDRPDPFVTMLLDIASKNIADPARASAGVPIPVRFTGDLIEKWRILKPEDPLDEWLLKLRDNDLGRLGDALSISRERVTGGMGEANHWGAWQLSEEETRLSFAPRAELVCDALTKSYLWPALMVSGQRLVGESGGQLIAWYDLSALTARPDKRKEALDLWDRGELSGTALRRESGFAESDAPDEAELTDWVWRQALKDPALAPAAIEHLIGVPVAPAAAPSAPVGGGGALNPVGPERPAPTAPAGPPPTMGEPPPVPGAPAIVAALANGHRR